MNQISREVFIEALQSLSSSSSSPLNINYDEIDDNFINEFLKPHKFSPFPNSQDDSDVNFLKMMQGQFESLKLGKDDSNFEVPSELNDALDINNWWEKQSYGVENKKNENILKLGSNLLKNLNKQQRIIEDYNDGKENKGELNQISNNVDKLQKEMDGLQEFVYDMTKSMGLSNELFNSQVEEIPKKKKKKKKKSKEKDEEQMILATKDMWICEFCEYERVFGEKPRQMIKWYDSIKNNTTTKNDKKAKKSKKKR